jgi:ABC-type sulfate transport system substrate-binding protein
MGAARLDGVITYEQAALKVLEPLDAHPSDLSRLSLIYPNPTLVARHPAVLLSAEPAVQDAAQRWLRYLRSKPLQHEAIRHGFRPVDPSVSLRDPEVEYNAFLRLRRFGVSPQPRFVEPIRPAGKLLQEILARWDEATELR